MGSTRLPGKVLADVAGRPLLAHMLERVSLARSLDAVWVATSDAIADDAIARLAEAEGVPVFRGSEADVLGRYAGAAEAAGARTVVRLTADCPLLAPEVIDRVVAAFGEGGHDIATNTGAEWRTYPDGMDVEVLTRDTLDRLAATVEDPRQREHVTARLYDGGLRAARGPPGSPAGRSADHGGHAAGPRARLARACARARDTRSTTC